MLTMTLTACGNWTLTQAKNLIERELGVPADSVFAKISDDPVAAASLGQVCTLAQTPSPSLSLSLSLSPSPSLSLSLSLS